jgi:hypothetical protein
MKSDNESAIKITNNDLPALFNEADKASIEGQKKYLKFIKLDLFCLVLAALLLSFDLPELTQKIAASLSAIFFAASLVLTIILSKTRYEKVWHGARAVAESTKTLSWRYMTCTDPFAHDLGSARVDSEFVSRLKKIISEHKDVLWSFEDDLLIGSQITETMRRVRNLEDEKRKQIYLEQRINDQRKWYSNKANQNRRLAEKWFYALLFSQLLAIASAILIAVCPGCPSNLAGVFSALVAAFLAWTQVKRHKELAQSYRVAAQELGMVAELAIHVKEKDDLCKFVSDAEDAISKEHTLWIAKRIG